MLSSLSTRAALQTPTGQYDEIPKLSSTQSRPSRTAAFFSTTASISCACGSRLDRLHHQRHQQAFHHHHAAFAGFLPEPGENFRRKLIEMLIASSWSRNFPTTDFRVLRQPRRSGTAVRSPSPPGRRLRSYFNKDLKDITLPKRSARRLIQAPSALSPYRHPERALERRNTVIEAMSKPTHHARTADRAKATPLNSPANVEASDAPYFVDMVRDTVVNN